MLEVICQTYVMVARAKGLPERVVLVRHALRNALIPLITVIALLFPGFVGGSVIVEQVFAWPGMGTLAITAVIRRDYPVIMAINLMATLAVVLSSLIADILYVVADPRIRYRR
jgi:peptide/nickel transport system permease protein